MGRSRKEDETNADVPFLNPKDNFDEYDIIYLGFACWWRSYPRIIATFLRKYSLIGKNICSVTKSKTINNVKTMTYNYYQAHVKPKPEAQAKG